MMIRGQHYLVEYLSQGTTLKKGSVIMTGTPSGELCHLKVNGCGPNADESLDRCWLRHVYAAFPEAGDEDGNQCFGNWDLGE